MIFYGPVLVGGDELEQTSRAFQPQLALTPLALPVCGYSGSKILWSSPSEEAQISEAVGRSADATARSRLEIMADSLFLVFQQRTSDAALILESNPRL